MLWDDNLGFPGSPGKGFIKESGMIRDSWAEGFGFTGFRVLAFPRLDASDPSFKDHSGEVVSGPGCYS